MISILTKERLDALEINLPARLYKLSGGAQVLVGSNLIGQYIDSRIDMAVCGFQ